MYSVNHRLRQKLPHHYSPSALLTDFLQRPGTRFWQIPNSLFVRYFIEIASFSLQSTQKNSNIPSPLYLLSAVSRDNEQIQIFITVLVCTVDTVYLLYLAIVATATGRLTPDKSVYLGPVAETFIYWNGRNCLLLSCREGWETHYVSATQCLWLCMLRWHLKEGYFKLQSFLLQSFQTNNYPKCFPVFWSWGISFKYPLPGTSV